MRTIALSEGTGTGTAVYDGAFENLAPDAALPTQFQDVWWRTRRIAPEPRLALAVLQLAVVDLLKYRGARDPNQRRLYRKAYAWITSGDREWPYSYLNLCDAIEIAPGSLRDRILSADERERRRAVKEVGKLLDICHG